MSSLLLYLSLTTQFYSVLSNMLPVYMNKTQHNNAKKIILLFSSHFRYSTFLYGHNIKLDRSIIRLLLLFIRAFLQLFDNTDNSGGDHNDDQDTKHGC